jgi:hypothetical protein
MAVVPPSATPKTSKAIPAFFSNILFPLRYRINKPAATSPQGRTRSWAA